MSRNAFALLDIARTKHGISWVELSARVRRDEGIEADVADDLVERFRKGESCPVVVAAALITIIASRREVMPQ